MRLFTVGPVEMRDEIRALGGEAVPYFRTPEFSDLMLDSDRLLKKMMGTAETSRSIYLTASGSGAMEAAVLNCFTPDDRLLVVNGGSFGQRFVDICGIHGIPHEEIRLAEDEALSAEHFAAFDDVPLTGVLVNIDETSTGQLYDIRLLTDFCQRRGLYLMVDAISSFLCDPYEMDRWGIDVTIISSQKGLCVPPGMSVVVLNRRIWEERVEKSTLRSLYFDFRAYAADFERGQTPFTPAVGICVQMNRALRLIDKQGLEAYLAHIAQVASDFREKAVARLPVKVPEYPLSNAITPLVFAQGEAYRVFAILKESYGVMVNPTGGALHDKVLRVAHIGKTDVQDNDFLLDCMEKAIRQAQKAC